MPRFPLSVGPVSTGRSGEGEPPETRAFRLALSIEDDSEMEGAHLMLAVVQEPDKPSPVVIVKAFNFPSNDEGAAEIAALFDDVASAIREYVQEEADVQTADLPSLHAERPIIPDQTPPPTRKVPRFNPQPRGAK